MAERARARETALQRRSPLTRSAHKAPHAYTWSSAAVFKTDWGHSCNQP